MIQKLFKPYIVRRKNGQCQVLIPLVELDELCHNIMAHISGKENESKTERCQRCGKWYAEVYSAPDWMWGKVTGLKNGSGLFCMQCFDEMARSKKVIPFWKVGLYPKKESEE